MLRADSFEKTLILGKIEGRRRRRQQRMRWLDAITIHIKPYSGIEMQSREWTCGHSGRRRVCYELKQ